MITDLKTLAKKLLAVRPEKVTRMKKRKTRIAIAKLFALHANATIKTHKCCHNNQSLKGLETQLKKLT